MFFFEAYDKGDNGCLYEFSIPRAKRALCYISDDDEAFVKSSYYDIMEHIRYSQLDCQCFKQIFINLSKTVEELVSIFYNSIQDYFDNKSIYNSIYPKHYEFCNANVCHSLYYSTEYDDYYDDEDDFYEAAETLQNDRADFVCNDLCSINGAFNKFYSN